MWYARFGEDSVSLEDQRMLDSRKRREHCLRRTVTDARREVVLLQRAQQKHRRAEDFLRTKEECLDRKLLQERRRLAAGRPPGSALGNPGSLRASFCAALPLRPERNVAFQISRTGSQARPFDGTAYFCGASAVPPEAELLQPKIAFWAEEVKTKSDALQTQIQATLMSTRGAGGIHTGTTTSGIQIGSNAKSSSCADSIVGGASAEEARDPGKLELRVPISLSPR